MPNKTPKRPQENLSLLEDSEQDAPPKRQRQSYDQREKGILLHLVSSLYLGEKTIKEMLENGVTTNEKRHQIWIAVADHFNKATSRQVSSDDVKNLYQRIKDKAKKQHDQHAIDAAAFRKSCKQTGGGMGLAMPPAQDGDEYVQRSQEHFGGAMEPPGNAYNTFNRPSSSRAVLDLQGERGGGGNELDLNEGTVDLLGQATVDIASLESITRMAEFVPLEGQTVTIHSLEAAGDGSSLQSEQLVATRQRLAPSPAEPTWGGLAPSPAEPTWGGLTPSPPVSSAQTATARGPPSSRQRQTEATVRTQQVPVVRNQPLTESRKSTGSEPRKSTGSGGKEAAATNFYEETLKQRKTLARYKKSDAKFSINIKYLKTTLLVSQLEQNGIPYQLPFKNIPVPSSSDESETEEEDA